MKILHVVPALGLKHGGVSVSVRELCRGLKKSGLEVEIFSTPRGRVEAADGPDDDHLQEEGIRVRYFPVHPCRWLGERYAYSPAFRKALSQEVPQADLVHIHAVWLYTTWAASSACRRARVPYILSPCGALDPYGMGIRRGLKWLYGLAVEKQNLAAAAAIHFTSTLEARRAQTFGISRPRFVVPRPIRPEAAQAGCASRFRQGHPEVQDREIVLFLGRLDPKKRPELAAEAFVGLARRRKNVHLVMAGPDAGMETPVRRILARGCVSGHLTLTGLLKGQDKWDAYAASRLFVLPSLDENFGVTVLEAMAAGVPVLISTGVGLAETAHQAGAGLQMEGDAADWAAAMEYLLAERNLARRMSEAGRELVRTRFTPDRVAAEMKRHYSEILRRCASA